MKSFGKDRALAAIAVVLVVAAIIRGLFMIGPLDGQRKRKFDDKRTADLQQVATLIDYYYTTHHELPEYIGMVYRETGINRLPLDPETGESYSYRIISSDSYELCAKFSMKSDDRTDFRWAHNTGKTCYRLSVRH
ncbi:MAG TPA: hypothetical protein VN371_05560 [Chlorobaculum sp.]|nr:hypothetical protein [Chlorobaculum sp.]